MDALFLRLGGLSMVGIILGLAILLADAFSFGVAAVSPG